MSRDFRRYGQQKTLHDAINILLQPKPRSLWGPSWVFGKNRKRLQVWLTFKAAFHLHCNAFKKGGIGKNLYFVLTRMMSTK
jgi:hypothetical protein